MKMVDVNDTMEDFIPVIQDKAYAEHQISGGSIGASLRVNKFGPIASDASSGYCGADLGPPVSSE